MRRAALFIFLLSAGCKQVVVDPSTLPPDDMPPTDNPDLNNPECQLQSPQERTPGWPYELPTFRDTILPMLINDCGACHAPPSMSPLFTVWRSAAPGNCAYAQTFNSMQANVDLANPSNSALYTALSGGDPAHPLRWNADDPRMVTLLAFLTKAAETYNPGSGMNNPPPPPASPFKYDVFETVIQPAIDTAANVGCSIASCHGGDRGIGGFAVKRQPAAGSQEMVDNFNAVTQICNLQNPAQSVFYLQATHQHGAGTSALMSADQAAAVLDWITKAATDVPSGPSNPTPTCAGVENFDLATFEAEIEPILFGEIDLNDRDNPRVTTGCARSACHGKDRTGGALVLKESNTPAENLANFACFVNFENPVSSDILQCPSNLAGCSHAPHPGDTIFPSPADLNYQRILSYLYGAKTAATPLDFAFFVRRINPIFSDPSAIAGGVVGGRTCGECHGVAVVGQRPPNGSNFPVIASASDEARLGFNFSSASNFVNVIQPEGSSLFLYPTNQIANLQNPFATGFPHPGGEDFAVDSQQAKDILTWARGLRPDANGVQKYWLVAGDFSGTLITDQTAVDEVNIKPTLFDPSGSSFFNDGKWDGLFSDNGLVDLNLAFPRAQTSGRIAYAVAYILNTSANDIQAQIAVQSNNAIKVYVDQQPVLQSENATVEVPGFAFFPAYATARRSTRIMIKVLQRATDPDFAFTARLVDENNNPLSDFTGEIVIKLSTDGGI